MGEDLGDRREGRDRNGCVDVQAIENFHQILVPMDGDAMLFGDRDDLRRDRAPPLGQNPRQIVATSLIAERYGRRRLLFHAIRSFPACTLFAMPRASLITW